MNVKNNCTTAISITCTLTSRQVTMSRLGLDSEGQCLGFRSSWSQSQASISTKRIKQTVASFLIPTLIFGI